MLHPEVRVPVTINVARTEDEAERQARGEDVLTEKTTEEDAAVEATANAEAMFEDGVAPKVDGEEAEEA